MYTEIGGFEWDSSKARSNFQKHRIRFKEATTAFDDPFALIYEDLAHSQHEQRQQLIGETGQGRLLLIIFTIRLGLTIRLISARPANRTERIQYAYSRYFSLS